MSAPPQSPYDFECRDGVLHIHAPHADMRLRWRPTPQADRRPPGLRTWRCFRPEFRLVSPQHPNDPAPASVYDLCLDGASPEVRRRKEDALAAFGAQIPADLTAAAARFGSHQWALMVFMQSHPHARDLAASNPVLAYALANHDLIRGAPGETATLQATAHTHARQVAILAWLGFPDEAPMVRLMRKLRPEWVSPSLLRRLATALSRDPSLLRTMAHLPSLNAAVLDLVTNWPVRPLITPKLLMEAARESHPVCVPSMGDRLQEALVMVRDMAPRRPVRPFTSFRQVVRFHEEIVQEYQGWLRAREEERAAARAAAEQRALEEQALRRAERRRARRQEAAGAARPAAQPTPPRPPPDPVFPPPPVPGTPEIVPLTTIAALRSEGEQQQNCVATYAARVLSGETYIYQVLAPERATLSIVRGPTGRWCRSELKARANRRVRPSTAAHVDAWLRARQP